MREDVDMSDRGNRGRRGRVLGGLTVIALALVPASLPNLARADPPIPKHGLMRLKPGWDQFNAPLDYDDSAITWSLDPLARTLRVDLGLVRSTPSALHQFSIHFFCRTFPATFGQFPVVGRDGTACRSDTKQGVTRSVAAIELGAVTTDLYGNGNFGVEVGPIAPGTYNIEFVVRKGAGCNLVGGDPGPDNCGAIHQAPGAVYGKTWTLVVPAGVP